MGTSEEDRYFFPLTSLQIGDLQSYLSELTLFLVPNSNKFLILVDNRPWLAQQDTRPTHLWQYMVTKSRLSPFANSKSRRRRKRSESGETLEYVNKSRWYSVIDAAIYQKKTIFPVKKLKDSFLLNEELHRTLYGFIVFEVEWVHVRGINYYNELQTDTSMAMEAKLMKRWEFDSIEHASNFVYYWYSGSNFESHLLEDYLHCLCSQGVVFYDAREDLPNSPISESEDSIINPTEISKLIRSYSEIIRSPRSSISPSNSDPTVYKDVFIFFKFNDPDLPFKFKQVIMPDIRLLTLLEYGLPSWVIFLQSYPVFCKIYRPWMCPLARFLYVLISVITVLIGFYDLYKNVPVLKLTASRIFGPFFDWIESWEMVSRIKYLGTMLFLHHCEKGLRWFFMVTKYFRSVFSVLTRPISGPILELVELTFPLWNFFVEAMEDLSCVIFTILGSSYSVILSTMEIIIWPFELLFTTLWNIGIYVICPAIWLIWGIVAAPARLVMAISSIIGVIFVKIYFLLRETWSSLSTIFKFASTTEVSFGGVYEEASVWKSLWNDIFSQVFRAIRSILNGFVAFFIACNRHRLSIYNHMSEFFQRLSHATNRRETPAPSKRRKKTN